VVVRRVILDWPRERNCADLTVLDFYPNDDGPVAVSVLERCDSCVIRSKCAEYAIENDERYGVWGGLIRGERQRIIAARESLSLIRNKSIRRLEIPTCKKDSGPSARGYRIHIENGEQPCTECRRAYRKKQLHNLERKKERELAKNLVTD